MFAINPPTSPGNTETAISAVCPSVPFTRNVARRIDDGLPGCQSAGTDHCGFGASDAEPAGKLCPLMPPIFGCPGGNAGVCVPVAAGETAVCGAAGGAGGGACEVSSDRLQPAPTRAAATNKQ